MKYLIETVTRYDYPAMAFDFKNEEEMEFADYRSLEMFIKDHLLSKDIIDIKDGLSCVLYWGHYRAGYRDVRVRIFRNQVTTEQLERFRDLVAEGDLSLLQVKSIGMPQFSGMAFISKVCMFFNPAKYVTLDKKIMQLKDQQNPGNPLSAIPLGEKDTMIRVTERSQKAYERWCAICRQIAAEYFEDKIAADVERGFFKLVEQGGIDYGRRMIKQVEEQTAQVADKK